MPGDLPLVDSCKRDALDTMVDGDIVLIAPGVFVIVALRNVPLTGGLP